MAAVQQCSKEVEKDREWSPVEVRYLGLAGLTKAMDPVPTVPVFRAALENDGRAVFRFDPGLHFLEMNREYNRLHILAITIYELDVPRLESILKQVIKKSDFPRALVVLGGGGVVGYQRYLLEQAKENHRGLFVVACKGTHEELVQIARITSESHGAAPFDAHPNETAELARRLSHEVPGTACTFRGETYSSEKSSLLPILERKDYEKLMDAYSLQDYLRLPYDTLNVGSVIGCPHGSCTFCTTPVSGNTRGEFLTPPNGTLVRIVEELGPRTKHLMLGGCVTADGNQNLRALVSDLEEEQLDPSRHPLEIIQRIEDFLIPAEGEQRQPDRDLMKRLMQIGCREVVVGLENPNAGINTRLGKMGYTFEEASNVVAALAEEGLHPYVCIIPFDYAASLKEFADGMESWLTLAGQCGDAATLHCNPSLVPLKNTLQTDILRLFIKELELRGHKALQFQDTPDGPLSTGEPSLAPHPCLFAFSTAYYCSLLAQDKSEGTPDDAHGAMIETAKFYRSWLEREFARGNLDESTYEGQLRELEELDESLARLEPAPDTTKVEEMHIVIPKLLDEYGLNYENPRLLRDWLAAREEVRGYCEALFRRFGA